MRVICHAHVLGWVTYTSGASVAAASNAPPLPNALLPSDVVATEPKVTAAAPLPKPKVAPLNELPPNENDGLEPNEPNVGAIISHIYMYHKEDDRAVIRYKNSDSSNSMEWQC
jgi:hypothetical protein